MTDDAQQDRMNKGGDERRVLVAVKAFHAGDLDLMGVVTHEAHDVGRGHHFVLSLIRRLADSFGLEKPDQMAKLDAAIAHYTTIEEGKK